MKYILRLTAIFLTAACMVPVSDISAQITKRSVVQFTLIPPISTNGEDAAQYTNTVSLNLLAGVSMNEKGFALGGLANIIGNDTKGVQIAGLYNRVGGRGRGVLFSGMINNVKLYYTGVQFAGLANLSGSYVEGAQFAGLMNLAEDVEGAQFAGLMNLAEDVEGVQFAGLTNVVEYVEGAQFAGLVNVAEYVDGPQFAGLVNIAEDCDTPFGLVNIIRNGEMGVGVTYDETGNVVASFRSGGRNTYGILGAGYNHKADKEAFVVTAGIGAHILFRNVPWLRINNELTVESIGNFKKDRETFRSGYALLPAFRLGKHLELFGGPSINYMVSKNPAHHNLFSGASLWKKYDPAKRQQIYIGYRFGVHICI